MTPKSILIVAKHFWPHSGLTEQSLAELARNFFDAGHKVDVATFRWSKEWSPQIRFHSIRVYRYSRPVSGPWSSFRHSRAMQKHFQDHHYDAIISCGIGDETAAVVRTAPEETPIIAYVDESYPGVERKLHQRHIEVCQAADALVANSEAVRSHLSQYRDIPAVHVIEPGLRKNKKYLNKYQLRHSFNQAHSILNVEKDQPLVVTACRLDEGCKIDSLIAQWPNVAREFPNAKLWVFGDGPLVHHIWQNITGLDLSFQVIMTGYFDHFLDVLNAADLYVHPAGPHQSGDGLIRAIHAGLPAVAIKNRTTFFLQNEFSSALKLCDFPSLAKTVVETLRARNELNKIGFDYQDTEKYSVGQQIGQFVKLIDQLNHQPVPVESAK